MDNRSAPSLTIVAPPPTPNGDLHLGHLSGPYFGADVLRRYASLRGRRVTSAVSLDVHQSYVVTAAERLGVEPARLAKDSGRAIRASFDQAAIKFDVVGTPDPSYAKFVTEWFGALLDSGALTWAEDVVEIDRWTSRPLSDAFAVGYCPICLAASCANICEACGHPSRAEALVFARGTGGGDRPPLVDRTRETRLVLELEPWRDELRARIDACGPARPGLARLAAELFAAPLPAFPITSWGSWGLCAAPLGLAGQVINPWAEMLPGHLHWLAIADQRIDGGSHDHDDVEPLSKYVQFFGFDNSFFYAFAHVALALSARRAGMEAPLPDRFIVNEFYELDDSKFSTSQGNVLTIGEVLDGGEPDALRWFLALTNPECQRASFDLTTFHGFVNGRLNALLDGASDAILTAARDVGLNGGSSRAGLGSALLARFAAAYEPAAFSLRLAATAALDALALLPHIARNDPEAVADFVAALAAGMVPIAPNLALRFWRTAGLQGAVRWPDAGRC